MTPSQILNYLNGPYREGNIEHKSPYVAALIHARAATGRNVVNGEIVDKKGTGNWLGAIAYIILIDHVGNFFSKSDSNIQDQRSFIKALKEFTELSDKEIYALYALRCAFAHTFSLINEGQGNEKELLHHYFSVTKGDEAVLVSLPPTPWDGVSKSRAKENATVVNLEKLGNLVEEIHLKLLGFSSEGKLNVHKKDELIFISYQVQD